MLTFGYWKWCRSYPHLWKSEKALGNLCFAQRRPPIVRKLAKETGVGFKAKDWVEFNSTIESMTLEAFDCYSAQREKIYQLKVDESKNKAFMLLKKAGI